MQITKKEIKIQTHFKDVRIIVDGKHICHNFSFYDWELSLDTDDEILKEVLEFIFESNISNVQITIIEESKGYFHFYIECECTSISSNEKLIKKAIKQIKRLQYELLSMQSSAVYSSDYLQHKFQKEYVDIMENNSAQDYLETIYLVSSKNG